MRARAVGILVVATLVVSAIPVLDRPAEAACSPRLFRELGPAPNSIPPPDTAASPAVETAEPGEAAPPPDTAASPAVETTEPGEATPPPEPPPAPSPPPPRCSFVYRMEYPVVGGSALLSVFGAVREAGERWHAGVDISAGKLTPVVAVRSGTLIEVNRNGGGDCCWVKIQHTDGWQSLYVHLNNDVWATDDGSGFGIIAGLSVGDSVIQGQVIGYVGDSGNAEPGTPHLHFELRTPWGEAVDPLPSLRRATGQIPSGLSALENPTTTFDGPFADVVLPQELELASLATSIGVPLACDRHGLLFCGDTDADEIAARAWLEALTSDPLDPSAPPEPDITDLEQTSHETLLGAERRRFLRLCEEGCPTGLTRSELVDLILEFDPDGAVTAGLDGLYRSGLIDSCDGTARPEDTVLSRSGMLRMLMRVMGLTEAPPCELIS